MNTIVQRLYVICLFSGALVLQRTLLYESGWNRTLGQNSAPPTHTLTAKRQLILCVDWSMAQTIKKSIKMEINITIATSLLKP